MDRLRNFKLEFMECGEADVGRAVRKRDIDLGCRVDGLGGVCTRVGHIRWDWIKVVAAWW